jgi:hypothetical protein
MNLKSALLTFGVKIVIITNPNQTLMASDEFVLCVLDFIRLQHVANLLFVKINFCVAFFQLFFQTLSFFLKEVDMADLRWIASDN